MANCPKCGAFLKEGQKFCTKCGAKIELSPPEVTAQIDILKKRIEKDSLNPKFYVELGDIYRQNNLHKEALLEYQKAVSIDDSYIDAHLKSGDIYLKLQQLEKAEASYQKASNLNPKSMEAKIGLFRAYYFQKKIDEATKLGEELVKVEPKNTEIHQILKELYAKTGLKEKVLKELEVLASLSPDNKQIFKELARIYFEKDNIEKSLTYWQKVWQLDKDDVDARFELGISAYKKGDYERTIEYLRGLSEKKELAPTALSLAQCCLALAYINKGNFDYARSVVEQISPRIKDLTLADKKLFAELYYKVGLDAFQKKNLLGGIKYLENALKFEPENLEIKKNLDAVRIEQRKLKAKAKMKTLTIVLIATAIVILAIAFASWFYLTTGQIAFNYSSNEVAKIEVNGKEYRTGFLRLRRGQYKVNIQGNLGYADTNFVITIAEPKKTISVSLVYLPKRITGLAVSASSYDPRYPPQNIIDGNTRTCWVESEGLSCLNQWIKIQLPIEKTIYKIGIYPGYGKFHTKYGDLFWLNNRLRSAILTFSDGSTQELYFKDLKEMQYFDVTPPKKARFIILTITDYYSGTKWDDMCISEIEVWGH